jgi:rhamnose transport system permease protein
MPVAIAITLVVGLLGGALNAAMITKLKAPPLIVTLGTFSLFRGIAEGLTRGIENYSGFSPSFLFLGQGYVGGVVPTQLFIFVPAIAFFWWWLHRTAFGRSYYAIGFSQEGSRYAGIKVRRRLNLMYCLSGLLASLAAVIYVAHLGQAKSDAGTGYELTAIAAVVLGGASIFGGRGTVLGTILGLLAIVILQNGLRISGQPTELAGILTGVLLVITILIDRLSRIGVSRITVSEEEFEVKNWQIGVLSGVILLAAIIVAASNWVLVRSIKEQGGATPATQSQNAVTPGKKNVIAMMPKAKGDPYFISCRKGAEEARRSSVPNCSGMDRPISIRRNRTRSSKRGSRAASMRSP